MHYKHTPVDNLCQTKLYRNVITGVGLSAIPSSAIPKGRCLCARVLVQSYMHMNKYT